MLTAGASVVDALARVGVDFPVWILEGRNEPIGLGRTRVPVYIGRAIFSVGVPCEFLTVLDTIIIVFGYKKIGTMLNIYV